MRGECLAVVLLQGDYVVCDQDDLLEQGEHGSVRWLVRSGWAGTMARPFVLLRRQL